MVRKDTQAPMASQNRPSYLCCQSEVSGQLKRHNATPTAGGRGCVPPTKAWSTRRLSLVQSGELVFYQHNCGDDLMSSILMTLNEPGRSFEDGNTTFPSQLSQMPHSRRRRRGYPQPINSRVSWRLYEVMFSALNSKYSLGPGRWRQR